MKDNFIRITDKLLSKSLEGMFMKIKLFVGVLLIIAGLIMAIIGGMNLVFALENMPWGEAEIFSFIIGIILLVIGIILLIVGLVLAIKDWKDT